MTFAIITIRKLTLDYFVKHFDPDLTGENGVHNHQVRNLQHSLSLVEATKGLATQQVFFSKIAHELVHGLRLYCVEPWNLVIMLRT